MTSFLARLLADPRTERFIIGLIILNAITLGLETSRGVMDAIGPILLTVDSILLSIFVAELSARMAVQRRDFIRDPWNVFDFAVVAVALVPATGAFSVLRALPAPHHRPALAEASRGRPDLRSARHGIVHAAPGADLLRLRRHGDETVRRHGAGSVRIDGSHVLHALPGHDLRRLVGRDRQAAHGGSPLRHRLLPHLHPALDLHGAEPVHRRHRVRARLRNTRRRAEASHTGRCGRPHPERTRGAEVRGRSGLDMRKRAARTPPPASNPCESSQARSNRRSRRRSAAG